MNDKPLSGAHVLFQPVAQGLELEAGPESVGRTDGEGRFTLRTIQPEKNGATIGTHTVKVTIQEEEDRFGGGGESAPDGTRLPAKYTIPDRYRHGTELKVEVPPGGIENVELKLTSP